MCTWDDVRGYLDCTVLPLVQNQEVGHRWLQALGDPALGRVQGKVLGTCLAIDLDSRAVAPELVASLIDRLPEEFGKPCQAFAAVLREHPDAASLIGASQHTAQLLSGMDVYARVLTVEGFIDTVGEELCLTLSDRPQALAYLDESQPMRYVRGRLRGRRGCAWVTRQSVIEELLRHPENDSAPATLVVGALGLYMTEGDDHELVMITYPADFEKQMRFAHPTSLDSRWDVPHYFMAYRSVDGFGRTHTLMQMVDPCPERIHPNYEGPLDGFSAYYVGERTQIPDDQEAYLRAALERFCDSRHSSNPGDAA